jgi:Fur family zinc uptake transcriptional regulator
MLSAPAGELVLGILREAKEPMTAYTLLKTLKERGINSPPIIYRALDALMKSGAVHKIKELSAFIACNCGAGHNHALSVLTVCGGCSKVAELHDHAVIHHLEALRTHGVELREHAVIELPITCHGCTTSSVEKKHARH